MLVFAALSSGKIFFLGGGGGGSSTSSLPPLVPKQRCQSFNSHSQCVAMKFDVHCYQAV